MRTVWSVSVGIGGAETLRSEDAAEPAVPRSVPVPVAYELQEAGHRYLDVRAICLLETTRVNNDMPSMEEE